jgi:Tfp pilus assembly protein PilZ
VGRSVANDERRRYPRIRAGISVVEIAGDTAYFQYASNLSEGGVFLERTLSHEIGTRVALLFKVPDQSDPISVEAEVVGAAADGAGMRLRFVDLDDHPDVLARVRSLIDSARSAA